MAGDLQEAEVGERLGGAGPSPAETQTDIAVIWQWLFAQVHSWRDLDLAPPREMERLIDFVIG